MLPWKVLRFAKLFPKLAARSEGLQLLGKYVCQVFVFFPCACSVWLTGKVLQLLELEANNRSRHLVLSSNSAAGKSPREIMLVKNPQCLVQVFIYNICTGTSGQFFSEALGAIFKKVAILSEEFTNSTHDAFGKEGVMKLLKVLHKVSRSWLLQLLSSWRNVFMISAKSVCRG